MYEPDRTLGQLPGPQRTPPPRPVQNAVKLMYAGAAIELIALVVALITQNTSSLPCARSTRTTPRRSCTPR